MFAIPAFYYTSLPEEIPIHFNLKGEADNFADRSTIWFLPIFGLLLILVLRFILKLGPKRNKYKIPKELPPYFGEFMCLFILTLFIYIDFATIQVALDNWKDLGSWFIYSVILIFTFGALFMAYRQISSEKKS